jgi:hypothetical protein
MNIEKWVCNKCGSPCKVEIHYDSKGPAGDVQRFRQRCIAGTKDIPEDHSPEWRRHHTIECVKTLLLTEQRDAIPLDIKDGV